MPSFTPDATVRGHVEHALSRIERALIPPYAEGKVALRDGRKLAYAAFGDPRGLPVLWFHGTPGARRQLPPDAADVAERLGMRLIGIDRPGVGESCPHPERTLLSWAEDVRELVDRLGLERFGVAGISGGGPHVLSVAYALAERVTGAALLGTLAPLGGRDAPPGLTPVVPKVMDLVHAARGPLGDMVTRVLQSLSVRAAESAFPLIMRLVPPSDRAVLDTPRMRAMFVSDLFRGSRESFRAQVQDMSAYGRDWGFSVRDVQVPARLWHGTDDQLVPFAHAEHLVSLLPNAELRRFEGEGHFAGFVRPYEVLGWLKERALDAAHATHPCSRGLACADPRIPTQ